MNYAQLCRQRAVYIAGDGPHTLSRQWDDNAYQTNLKDIE